MYVQLYIYTLGTPLYELCFIILVLLPVYDCVWLVNIFSRCEMRME
jgi:hypothetical protein